jgi:hypothetical protein
VVEEIAAMLEPHDVPYAAIDLDWLIWANVEGGHGPAARTVLERNLAAVIRNYRDAGLARFLLAGYVEDAEAAAAIAEAVGMPTRVVRLVAPIDRSPTWPERSSAGSAGRRHRTPEECPSLRRARRRRRRSGGSRCRTETPTRQLKRAWLLRRGRRALLRDGVDGPNGERVKRGRVQPAPRQYVGNVVISLIEPDGDQ